MSKKKQTEKKEYTIVKYIKRRVLKENKNFIVSIIGPTGSGKSYTAGSIGELIDEEFTASRVVFSAKDLMDLINDGSLKSGSVIVWDEAGIGLSSRKWQSKLNRVVNYLLQTFRHRNFVLIFTVPYASFIDAASRRLFHAEFETVGIDKKAQVCNIKPKMLQYNPGNDKWYKKYLKVIVNGSGVVKIQRWSVPKPSEEWIEAYERRKKRFTDNLNIEIQEDLDTDEDRKKLTPFQEKVLKCWEEGIFVQVRIAEKLNVSNQRVSENERYMYNKGYKKRIYMKKLGNQGYQPKEMPLVT